MDFSTPDSTYDEPPVPTWPKRLMGFGLALFAVVMLGCLFTYNVGEMGWSALNPYNADAAAKVPCTNLLGVVGLYMAGMLYWLLGAAAVYGMLLLLFPAGALLFFPRCRMLQQCVAALCMLLCACAVLSVQPWYLLQWAAAHGVAHVGGKVGYLDGSCVMAPLLGQEGALLLLIAAHGVALIYFARMGFLQFCHAVAEDFRRFCAYLRRRREERQERREADRKAWMARQQQLREEEAAQRAAAEQEAAQRAAAAERETAQRAAAAAEREAAYRRSVQTQPAAQQTAVPQPAAADPQQGAPLPPRHRSGILSRFTQREPEPVEPEQPEPEEEEEELPRSLEEQMEQARRRDAERERTQSPITARDRRTPRERARDRENLLELLNPVEERIALSNAPGRSLPPRPFAEVPAEEAHTAPFAPQQPAPQPRAARPAPAPRPTPAPRVNTPPPHQATLGLDTREQQADYPLPPYDMLKFVPPSTEMTEGAKAEMQEMQQNIIDTLGTFKIPVEPGDITRGPSITRYEFYPPRGLRVKRIADLRPDLMLATKAKEVTILAPIPGKNTVGIELENATKEPVYLRELLQSAAFADKKLRIPVALGKDVYGNAIIGDLAAMPHTLVAGTTGSGKSVCINSMILSMLYKFRPDELKLILVDPKVVEMQPYRKLPHLACPVVTVPARVIGALRWAVNEMEHRYNLFSKCGVRNFEDYNSRDPQNDPSPYGYDEEQEDEDNPGFDPEAFASEIERQAEEEIPLGEEEDDERDDDFRFPDKMPYIVIIIDELADLMLTVKEDLEAYIARLTQKARAAGIHLVAATQTPRANVVTGTIKANIPSRIAFKVASPLDSRVILDTNGAETLLGKGDSIFLPPGGITKMTRIQGAFVSDSEIASIVAFCASLAKQKFEQGVTAEMDSSENGGSSAPNDNGGRIGHKGMSEEEDELYTRCVQLVITQRKASTSMLQRAFSIGYGRAAKIMDAMEKHGIIAPASGNTARPREVLVDAE